MVQRYRYAEDEAGQFVDVQLLTRDTRHILGPYKCLSCGDRVIPSLGERVTHHFRHKQERACSGETYLHEAGKLAFLEAFQAAVAHGRPYPVQRLREEACRRHEAQSGKVCQFEPHLETFDLTRWVSRATKETDIDDFGGDVLLQNADGSVKLLVEIAVKHRCSETKIASGLKILEIPIASEDDIDRLRQGLTLDGVRGWGFNLAERPPIERLSCRGCRTSVDLFVVYASGKSVVVTAMLDKVPEILGQSEVIHGEVLPAPVTGKAERPIEIIGRYATRARFEGRVPVKSCTLCRRSAFSWRPEGGGPPIRCALRKAFVGHNEAATCEDYDLFAKAEDVVARRAPQKSRAPRATFATAARSIWD